MKRYLNIVRIMVYGVVTLMVFGAILNIANSNSVGESDFLFLYHDILRWIVFVAALVYFYWFYMITKDHVEPYDRISESAIIVAVIFNPFLTFSLDLEIWIFLELVFGWIFFLYTIKIKKISHLLEVGDRDWNLE